MQLFFLWIFPGAQGQGHVTQDHAEMMYAPIFNGIHSSPKEMHLQKCCDSFETECSTAYLCSNKCVLHWLGFTHFHDCALECPSRTKNGVQFSTLPTLVQSHAQLYQKLIFNNVYKVED